MLGRQITLKIRGEMPLTNFEFRTSTVAFCPSEFLLLAGVAMKSGEELTHIAMMKEFKRLSRVADKAKKEADEYIEIGTEMLAIHQEFASIVKSGKRDKATIKALDSLANRSKRAEKIRKKDLLKLMDKQSDAEITRDRLGSEIQIMEFRISLSRAS